MISQDSFLRKYLGLILLSFLLVLGIAGCQIRSRQPRARYGAALVWDASGNQMVLFGGRAKGLFGEKVLNDTWILNLEDHSWRKVPTRLEPPPRLTPGMVVDPENRHLILFGGLGNGQRFGDTWIFDLETFSWEEITPSTSPSPRSDVGMALAEDQRRVLLFGGYCQEFQREECAETWEFSLDTKEWSKLDAVNSPPVTYGLQLVYDSQNQRFLQWGGHMTGIEGGVYQSLGYSDTLWFFENGNPGWQIVEWAGSSGPQARYWHQLAWAPDVPGVLLIGGDGGRGFLDDTWIFRTDFNSWDRISGDLAPPPRVNAAVAYDSHQNQMILFGGLGEEFKVFGDLWRFSPFTSSWERLFP